MSKKMVFLLAIAVVALSVGAAQGQMWHPVEGKMLTKWGEALTPDTAWQEYPRPQMERPSWTNLNGMWNYAVTPKDAEQPGEWDGKILVPFALEAPLSGIGRLLEPTEALWYQRNFRVQSPPTGRLLLHFEAVDYKTQVWVNDQKVGEHVGGNLPFSFDITEAVKRGMNSLVLCVHDATNAEGSSQLRGKQVLDNQGIWYTRVSGIWQTAWLEEVPARYISGLDIDTKIDGTVTVAADLVGTPVAGERLRVVASLNNVPVASETGSGTVTLAIPDPKLWSPASPTLYTLEVALLDSNWAPLDRVGSYTGIREVGKVKDADGNWRFTLNGKQIFHWGPLDQGWWPDGLLTPPSDTAMAFDIKFLKQAGFNMIRKHIKVEPRRYYYHMDRLGMLLWQDQVSGGVNPPWLRLPIGEDGKPKNSPPADAKLDADWPEEAHAQWMAEFKGMVDHLKNHPSIVVWVPFNEAWGQHRTMEVGQWISEYDPTRLVNIASGGNFFPIGDIADSHDYPHPHFPVDDLRYDPFVKVMGEFGGHGYPVQGHLWDKTERNWGYGGLPASEEEYLERYKESIRMLAELKAQGISAGVYTQTTDVEGEINGLITYDRKRIKIPAKQLREIRDNADLVD